MAGLVVSPQSGVIIGMKIDFSHREKERYTGSSSDFIV